VPIREPPRPEAELVLINARIWTPALEIPRKGAIAVGGGRVISVGSDARCESEATKDARVLDLNGCIALPGFVDAHAHLIHTGPRMSWIQLQNVRSKKQLLATIAREGRKKRIHGWILGRGWDESKWPERNHPTRIELDTVAGGIPALLRRIDGHMSVVNTAALRVLRLPRRTLGFEHDADGVPTGILRETANDLAGHRTRPTVKDLEVGFSQMMKSAHRLGITAVHDVVDARGMQAYQDLQRRGALGIRVNMMPLISLLPNLEKGELHLSFSGSWLRFGALKAFSDGSLGARTAALHEPYADSSRTRGRLEHKAEALKRLVRRAHRAGFQLGIHAIGDRAIDAVLDAYESALAGETGDYRHRIEHFELPTEEALERCASLGIVPVMQPNFVVQWSQPGGMYEARLGPERTARNNPHRLILKKGLHLAFGSDGMPYGPIYGLRGAVLPPFPNQVVSLSQALTAYSLGGARASFGERTKGRLVPGALADITVIKGGWDGRGECIRDWKVAATIVGGRLVYRTSSVTEA